MNVGDGSLASRFSMISLALLVDSFLRQRSTAAAAASSWNRSMMVVAVKSVHISEYRLISLTSELTPDSLLLTAQVLQSSCSPLESLDTGTRQLISVLPNPQHSLCTVESKGLVTIGDTLLVVWRCVIGETYVRSVRAPVMFGAGNSQAARLEKKTGSFLIETSIALV